MIAGIELGGTKTVVATGSSDGRVAEEWRFPTTIPEETFGRACGWLRERGVPSAIGVAAFGPLGVIPGREHYGKLLATPKPGGQGSTIPDSLHAASPDTRLIL